jgi:hypothetical protein
MHSNSLVTNLGPSDRSIWRHTTDIGCSKAGMLHHGIFDSIAL